MSNNDLSAFNAAIKASQKNERFPVMSLVKDNPALAAVLSKMVSSPNPVIYGTDGNRETTSPNSFAFKNTSEKISQKIADAKTVMQLLPDMELAAQILVSSIISPKDMVTTELNYKLTEGLISTEISAALISRTKLHFEQDYKIKPLLPKMLRDMLFETGSYPVAVIPENSIDEIINGSKRITMESLSDTINSDGSIKPLGLLGPAIKNTPNVERSNAGLSLESLKDYNPDYKTDGKITLESMFGKPLETFTTVSDNTNLLKIPRINQKIREQRIKEVIGSKAMESISSNMNDRQMSSMIYKERNFNYKPISALKTQEQLNRHSIGNPLILHLPTESVIPVYVPGCVEEQIGFFILIDADGNPVSRGEDADYYQQLSSRLNSNGSFPSAMLTRVKSQMQGFTANNKEHMDFTVQAYGEMIEQDLLARLRNGVYGNGVALAKNTEIYRIMLARALAKQHTQLLFIPIEIMSYFAFKYSNDGIGQSLLDDMKILNSLRSMIMFANVMSSLRNSIGRTAVNIKLDESDPNPKKTIEIAQHEIIRTRQQYFPLGMNSPTDLTDWLQKSGFEFTFEGHPGLPDTKVEFNEKQTNYPKPDTELEESLRKRAIMATGLSPDTVDASFNAEFATSIVTQNILLAKRVTQMQETFLPQLGNHMRKCVMNSEQLLKDLRKILNDNFDKLELELNEEGGEVEKVNEETPKVATEDEKRLIVNKFLNEFIMNFEVTLPSPNSVTIENQMESFKKYSEGLDAAIEARISEKFITSDVNGEVANQIATIKEIHKAYYLRKWMDENGVMSELADITLNTNNPDTPNDIYKSHAHYMANMTLSVSKFMVDMSKMKEATDKIITTIGGTSSDSGASDNTEGGGEGGEGGELGGLPDLGFDETDPLENTGGEKKDEGEPKEPKEDEVKDEEPKEDKEPKENEKKDDEEVKE